MAEIMTLEEVADYLRVTRKTIYRMVEKRAIPCSRVGHQWRFEASAVKSWLKQRSYDAAATLLVIDDDETVADLIGSTLKDAGHSVIAAKEAAEGLRIAQESDLDLVFLDLKMPTMDGAEVLKRIRLVKPDLPVVIITAFADGELMSKAMENGPFSVMKKPFAAADVVAAVNMSLRLGQLR